jgi:transcriptional regulator with XRE-family HTH domain
VHVQFRGKGQPHVKALQRIAQALKVPLVELFRYQEGGRDSKEMRKILREPIERSSDSELMPLYRLLGLR